MTTPLIRHGVTVRQFQPAEGAVVPADVYSPSRLDPVARAASVVVGGPAGRRLASAIGFWSAAPVLVLLSGVMLALGLVQKQHCRAQGWSSPDQFWHACYSDIPVLYSSGSLGATPRPSLSHALGPAGLGQSPISGLFMWIISTFVSHGSTAGREYFDLSAVFLVLALVVAVAALAMTTGRRSWDAAHLALSPLLLTAGLISYELLAVVLTAVALLALARSRPLIGGVLFGLAVASAPQVAILGVVVGILTSRYLRSTAGSIFAGSALACWFVVRVLLLPGLAGALGAGFKSWRDGVPGYGSLWLVPQLLGASDPRPADSLPGRAVQGLIGWIFKVGTLSGTTASVLAVLLFATLVTVVLRLTVVVDPPTDAGESSVGVDGSGAGVGVGTSFGVGPGGVAELITRRVAPLTLALIAVVLLTTKSFPVQASLLLLPFIALSGLSWRDHLIWAGTELVYFVGIWLYIAGQTTPSRGLPASFYLVLLLARLAGVAWIGIQGVITYRRNAMDGFWADPDCGQLGDGSAACGQISSQADDAGRLLDDRDATAPHHAG